MRDALRVLRNPEMMEVFGGRARRFPRGVMTKVPRDIPRPNQPEEDPPPILRSWRRLYFAVLAHLFVWIVLFYAFTLEFDRVP